MVPPSVAPRVVHNVAILPVLIPVWIVVFAAYGLYRERLQGFFDEALRVTSAVSVGMMTLLAGSFFYRQFSYSRLWVLFALGIGIALVLSPRVILRARHRAVR